MKWRLSLLAFPLIFASCAKHPRYDASPILPITLDESISGEHRDLLDLDLRTMSWAKISDARDAELFGVPDFSTNHVGGWLGERVKAIVGEDFNLRDQAYGKQKHVYKPEVLGMDAALVMINLGAALYLKGKELNLLAAVNFSGREWVVDSPRVGVLQIGPGLFDQNTVGAVGGTDNLSSSFRRLSTLYHEARHSDGNGEDVAFQHVICESGNYVGKHACDQYSNGAYTIGRILLEKLYPLCDDCSAREKEGLAILIADLRTRVVSTKAGDARPERLKL